VSDAAIPNGANAVTARNGGNPRTRTTRQPHRGHQSETSSGSSSQGRSAARLRLEGHNGVIFITTKRGQVGKPQFSISQKWILRAGKRARVGRSTLAERIFSTTPREPRCTRGPHVRCREGNLRPQAFSYETDASVSGAPRTQVLVWTGEDDAHRHQYRIQEQGSARTRQELGGGCLSVNLSGTHSCQTRLSNNDTRHSPSVFPFTPNFVNSARPSRDSLVASDSRAIRSSAPIAADFQFLKTTRTLAVLALLAPLVRIRTARAPCSSSQPRRRLLPAGQ